MKISQGSERANLYYVQERNGRHYIIEACTGVKYDGPFRYRWEAQEEADKLNGHKSDDA